MTATPKHAPADDLERQAMANINEFGWHAMNVIEGEGHPPWSFSIGLYETWSHPELIVIGRSRATAYKMLNTLATDIEMNSPPDLSDPNPTCSSA
jgi:hypothetical protein